MQSLIITTGYNCNNNCLFCYKDNSENKENKSTQEIKRELDQASLGGIKAVDFDGGEPTIRGDISEIVKYAKNIGFKKITIVTNGRMFAYKKLCKKIIDAGATSVLFSIHGHTAKLHDSLTQTPGSFEQAIQGVINVKELKKQLKIGVNTVVTHSNYKYLNEMLKFFKKIGINRVHLISICPIGQAYKNHEIIPIFSKVAPFIKDTIDKNQDLDIKVHNLPFCFMQDYEKYVISEAQLKYKREVRLPSKEAKNLGFLLGGMKIKRIFCDKCKYNILCDGVWKNYLKIHGDKEFKSLGDNLFSKMRFSYSYIKTDGLPASQLIRDSIKGKTHKKTFSPICRLKAGKKLLPREDKGLFYLEGNRLGHYKLEGPIEEKNMLYIKKFKQIYVSKSNNWPKGLFSARLSEECQKCLYSKEGRCAGYFVAASKNVSEESRYEQLFKANLKNLKGSVLDVGCGPVHYFKIFKHLVKKNKITYYGVDPDKKMITLLNSKIPEQLRNNFKGMTGTAENLEFPNNFFNTVFVIRSYNHIYDLDKALDSFKRVLKNKGRLIVADNVFFAVIQASKPKNENTKQEHYRAHTSFQAIRELKKYGFRVIEHRPVVRGENCWYVECQIDK